jgi:EAL domain-containing protein (putative c-di-GMP-specific phosphodiesterase class I)/DNA-binding NarL/FixJ family response regulator
MKDAPMKAHSSDTTTPEYRNYRVLLVDDDPAICKVAAMSLSRHFDDITIANDGKAGLEAHLGNPFDIIITDLHMPVMDGMAMIAKIRQNGDPVQIIVLSAHEDTHYFTESIRYGVEGFLLKPIDHEMLSEIVLKCISKLDQGERTAPEKAVLSIYDNMMFYDAASGLQYPADEAILQSRPRQKNWFDYTVSLIIEQKIQPFYQPIMSTLTGEIEKYEVLARGVDGKNIVPPHYLFHAAERKGITTTLTKMIIDKSFFYFASNTHNFSINITERDFKEGYLVDYLKEQLFCYRIDPARVTLEILESIDLTENLEFIAEQIRQLRAMGIKIAIDDFGVENSNFSRLLHIELDYIKLDGMYIRNIHSSDKKKLITLGIVKLAKTIGAELIAEFVEDETVMDIIRDCGVDYAQGYFVGKPANNISVA